LPYGFGRSARVIAGVFILVALLGACALVVPQTDRLHDAWPDGLPARAEITELPFFPQEDYQCGPAALATALAHFKVAVTPADLVDRVYLPARQGSLQVEMLAAPRTLDMLSYRLAPRFEDLLREVAAGHPVVVLQDYGVWPVSIWHYAVVAGYDRSRGELVLRSGVKERLAIPFTVFEYTWKESGYWAMVALPPDRLPVTALEAPALDAVLALERVARPAAATAAYAALLARWAANLPAAIGLANRQYAAGNLAGAEAVLREAAGRHPESVVLVNNLAQTLSDLGRDEEALRVIEPAIGRDGPFAPEVRATRAAILARLGRGLNLRASGALGGAP
jgi:tetratricopeptide (TPR) repeat protein